MEIEDVRFFLEKLSDFNLNTADSSLSSGYISYPRACLSLSLLLALSCSPLLASALLAYVLLLPTTSSSLAGDCAEYLTKTLSPQLPSARVVNHHREAVRFPAPILISLSRVSSLTARILPLLLLFSAHDSKIEEDHILI
jgi:hypothetical protein